MGDLMRLSDAKTRSICPENFTGEKGKGGMCPLEEGNAHRAARDLGTGWKVNPYIVIVNCDTHQSGQEAELFLRSNTDRCVVKSKSAQNGAVELNMEIRLKKDNTDFIDILSGLPGVRSAVLVSYNGDYMS